jgi:hypothetical protein
MTARQRLAALSTVLRRIPGIVIVPILAFVALGAWGLSSPPGSSPDDDFHLTSIWCGMGDRDGLCGPGDAAGEGTVARDVFAAACFRHEPEVSGACQGDDFSDNPLDTVSTDRGNFTGLYPRVFYAAMSVFASNDINASVVVIRLVNAAVFIGLTVAAYLLLPLRRRGPLLAGAILVMVPLGMFIIPSTNPSSWALASAAVLWVSVLGYLETTGRRRVGLGILSIVAAVLGAGARGDAALYAIAGVAIAIFLAFRRERAFMLAAILPIALAIAAGVLYLSTAQSAVTVEGFVGDAPSTASGWLGLFISNVINAPELWVGVFGGWGLGWLDTPIPASVWVVGFAVFTATIVFALRRPTWRVVAVLAGLAVLLVVLPSYVLTQTGVHVGSHVQPRYIMPLMVILVGVATYGAVRGTVVSRPLIVLGIAGLSVGNALALFTNTRRYVSGLDFFSPNLDANVEWWWAVAPSPLTNAVVGSLAFAVLLAVVATPLWRAARADLESRAAQGAATTS